MEPKSYKYSSSIQDTLQVSRSLVNHSYKNEKNLDYDAIIAELKNHSDQIRAAYKAVESSHAVLEKQVIESRDTIKAKEQELKLLNTWPLKIADDAQKWKILWESKFGKRRLNVQTSKLAENANVVEQTAQTVNYCRHFIQAKRVSHEEWRSATKEMRDFYESEIKRLQHEISILRNDVTYWELCATKNELCIVELNSRLKQLQLELLTRYERLENAKNEQKELEDE